jgi:predicted kinase
MQEKRYLLNERIKILDEHKVTGLSVKETCCKYKITEDLFDKWLSDYDRYKAFSPNFTENRYNKAKGNSIEDEQFSPILEILVGIPCSGKSTYAENEVRKKDVIVISTDEIRKELTNTNIYQEELNSTVFDIAYSRIEEALKKKLYVIFDATNTNKKYRKRVISIGKRNNAIIVATVFRTHIDVCIERNKSREIDRIIPNKTLLQWHNKFSGIDKSEGFHDIQYK